jgi:hypothetical protein
MLDVFLTVDMEIWCNNWNDIDSQFPEAFQRYVYGETPSGSYGLPYQLEQLKRHDLQCTFFVEPLFATRFGIEPLKEIVGLIQDAGQSVELHLHTEWVDEARPPIFPDVTEKRQHLRYFSLADQITVLKTGLDLLKEAGATEVTAFRAGSFAFNADSLAAIAELGLRYDSSYNATIFGQDSGVRPGEIMATPFKHGQIWEYPMTVFKDGTNRLRHAQLTACSDKEIENLLLQAQTYGYESFVFLLHNFELLNRSKQQPDWIVVKRFNRLCQFLNENRTTIVTRNFKNLQPSTQQTDLPILTTGKIQTGWRMMEQLYRKRYG